MTLGAQLLGFVVRELTALHALGDARGLVRLSLVHARIASARRRVRTLLCIVLLRVDVATRLVLLVLQIAPLGAGQRPVGLVGPLELANVLLLFREPASLTTRELARADTLLNAIALMLLARV